MIYRPFWVDRIEKAWLEAPIVWLCGVRRCGKTVLAQSLGPDRINYINCDLPMVEDMVRNPELFFRDCRHPIIVFDEIHQLKDPARLLKIGADMFPSLKILATGSSTLSAGHKFKDTLAGRKRAIRLTPITIDELPAFQNAPLLKRLYHGGLPQALLAEAKSPGFYREWMDSFFARDIQKLFAFRAPDKFNALFEYVMKQSGSMLETARTAGALGVSRQTVESHLSALELTHAVTLIRPFHGGGQKELVKTPKIYGFDTGFVSFFRGWDPLRPEDYGILWEHVVLERMQASGLDGIQYWRDAWGREVDFVVARDRDTVDAIECKWDPIRLDPTAIRVFRSYYPKGDNYLVAPGIARKYSKRAAGIEFQVCDPTELVGLH